MLNSFDASRNGSPIATVILDRSLGETPRRFSKALVLAAFVLENDARLPGSPADVLPEDADIESCFQQHGIVIGELLGRQCLTDILVTFHPYYTAETSLTLRLSICRYDRDPRILLETAGQMLDQVIRLEDPDASARRSMLACVELAESPVSVSKPRASSAAAAIAVEALKAEAAAETAAICAKASARNLEIIEVTAAAIVRGETSLGAINDADDRIVECLTTAEQAANDAVAAWNEAMKIRRSATFDDECSERVMRSLADIKRAMRTASSDYKSVFANVTELRDRVVHNLLVTLAS